MAISANDSEYLAEICRDISQSLLTSQGRSACEAQDEVLQVCDQLYINDKITENQLLYLRHLVLIREEEVAILYDKFQDHNNVSLFARDLYNLSCTHPHLHAKKSVPDCNLSDESSSMSAGHDQYYEVLTGIVALMVRSHTATDNEASVLLEMIKNENQYVVAAYELFESDNNLDEMQDTLLRCAKLELHKRRKQMHEEPGPLIQAGDLNVENLWEGTVPNKFVQLVFSSVHNKTLTMKQAIALCDLFQAEYDLLVSAWEVFTVQNGEMDFLDTVRRIANDVGTSDDVASGADVAHAKKELLLQCLEVLVKQSMMSTESAKIIFGKFVQGERSVSDAVDSCTKNSNIQAFLQTLCSLPDHFVENEIVDIIRSYPGISSDDVKILVDLVRTRDNKVVEVCHNFIENRDSAKLVSDLIAISQVDTEGPLLNVDAQKTVVEILKRYLNFFICSVMIFLFRANAISISQYTVLSEMISNGDHDLQDVFSVYEASRDVYALIDSLKNLCTEVKFFNMRRSCLCLV